MQIVLSANAQQEKIFLSKKLPASVTIYRKGTDVLPEQADAWFDLTYEERGASFPQVSKAPVFVNAVLNTSKDLPANYVRINAWNSFLERPLLEIVPAKQALDTTTVLDTLGFAYQVVPDVPGMIAARVIAMMINEAFFALGDEVSTQKDIDTAMKLGTNYPYGPFEWSELIGIEKIHQLLLLLSKEDDRYTPAPALAAAAMQKNTAV